MPDHAIERIDETEMPASTDGAIRQLLCTCFPDEHEIFFAARIWHGSAPHYSLIGRVEGEIRGHVGVVVREIRCGETPVVIAGIQSLAVHPDNRKSGLSRELMRSAMEIAKDDGGIDFGILFCVEKLEKFYASLGWQRIEREVTQLDEVGEDAPLPGKNIAMVLPLRDGKFPGGAIHLQGRDW